MKVQRNEMRRNKINKSPFFHKNLTYQKGKVFLFISLKKIENKFFYFIFILFLK